MCYPLVLVYSSVINFGVGDMMMNHRCDTRYTVNLSVRFTNAEFGDIQVFSKNISVTGMSVNIPECYCRVNSMIKTDFQILNMQFVMLSCIMHIETCGIGLLFEREVMSDEQLRSQLGTSR